MVDDPHEPGLQAWMLLLLLGILDTMKWPCHFGIDLVAFNEKIS